MAVSPNTGTKKARCGGCTIRLVQICSERAWWFAPARWPLVTGMRVLAKWHGIDPHDYAVAHARQECRGCLRFIKSELKEKSPLFVALNARINPVFNRLRNGLLTREEVAEAKRIAHAAFED